MSVQRGETTEKRMGLTVLELASLTEIVYFAGLRLTAENCG